MITKSKCGLANSMNLQSACLRFGAPILRNRADMSFCTSLATETDYVQGQLAEYAKDLISLGVDGLRLDAAKRAHWNFSRCTLDDAMYP